MHLQIVFDLIKSKTKFVCMVGIVADDKQDVAFDKLFG